MSVTIPPLPAHDHEASIPCRRGCPRFLAYRMDGHRCMAGLTVTATTVGWAPEEPPTFICGNPMPCPDHDDPDGRRGAS